MPKNVQTTGQLCSFHMVARLQQDMKRELPDVQAWFRKGRGTRDQIANIHWIIKKSRKFKKIIYLCFTDYTKALTVWITMNSEKFLKWWENHYILPVSWETSVKVKKKKLELDMEQLTGSNLGKEYDKAVYCHPACLFYMKSTSCKMPGWMNHKLESIMLGVISTTSDMQMIPLWWQKAKWN